MKIKKSIIFIFLMTIILVLMFCTHKIGDTSNTILTLLPNQNQLQDWQPFGESQYAKGEDLFLLINGGAEIYYEYGFRQAVIHSYSQEDGTSINVEIYEMEDAVSAYGMYTFKTGINGEDVPFGTKGKLEDYYLNFWKGPFVVTLIGFDTDAATRESLKKMAGLIADKITSQGTPPSLIKYVTDLSDTCSKITYIQGNLGLYNQYEFDTDNIFGVTKGVVGEYEGYKLLLLYYADSTEQKKWFLNAGDHLKESRKFSDYNVTQKGFTLKDSQGQLIWVTSFKNYILVYIGEDDAGKAEKVGKEVEEKL